MHDQYAAADIAAIIAGIGATATWNTPAQKLCSWASPSSQGQVVFETGVTATSLTTGTIYAVSSLDAVKQQCQDAVSASTPSDEIHLVSVATDCGAGYNPSNLVQGKAIAIGLCDFIVYDNVLF